MGEREAAHPGNREETARDTERGDREETETEGDRKKRQKEVGLVSPSP